MILYVMVKLVLCSNSVQIPEYATGTVQVTSVGAGSIRQYIYYESSPVVQTVSSTFTSTFSAQPQLFFATNFIDQGTGYQCQTLKITSLSQTAMTVQISSCATTTIYQYAYQYLAINDPYVYILNQTLTPTTSQTTQTISFTQSWSSVPSYAIAILNFQFQNDPQSYSGAVQILSISVSSVSILVTETNTNGLFPIQYNIIFAPTQFLNSVTQVYDWSQPYVTIQYDQSTRYCYSLPTITSPSVFVQVNGYSKMSYSTSNKLRAQMGFVPGGYIDQWTTVYTNLIMVYFGFNYQPFQCNGITTGNQCTCQSQYYISLSGCNQCSTVCLNCVTSATYCTSCNSNAQLSNNVCSCVSGYYMNTNNVCQKCDATCATCTQSSTTCTSCPANQILVVTSCQNCPVQTYFLNGSCQQCQANCQTCTQQYCTACQTNYLYQTTSCSGTQQVGVCVQTCYAGYFQNSSNSCCKCDVSCGTCSSSTQCLTCASNYVQQGTNCQLTCNTSYYNYQGTCLQCHQSCLTCSSYSSSSCLSCSQPQLLYQNQCQTQCPALTSNISGVCVQCFLGCQTCSGNSQINCLTCTTGYYFLINTCYQNCPLQYYNDQANYVCQPCSQNCNRCSKTQCITCAQNYYLFNNACYNTCPGQTYGDLVSQLCLQCDSLCATCRDGTNTGCTSCSNLLLSQGQCITTCLVQFYQSGSQCLQCAIASCYYCSGTATNCTACYNRYLYNNQCLVNCPTGYYGDIQQGTCLACDSSCNTCFGPNTYNCLSCSSGYLWNNTCIGSCASGTTQYNGNCFDQSYTQLVCSYQCDGCYLSQYLCQACGSNRLNNPPQCSCPLGYYDTLIAECQQCDHKCLTCSGQSNFCMKCLGNRLNPNCTCADGTYDDLQSQNCQTCQIQCATCTQSPMNCLTCRNNRVLNGTNCICEDTYFEINASYCQPCSYQCLTCESTVTNCSTCSDIRINPPLCVCPDGYYDNSSSKCLLCPKSCLTCNSLGCLTCPNNRLGPTEERTCICSTGALDLLPLTNYCQDCSIAVPLVSFDAQLKTIIVNLSTPVVTTITSCSDILSASSLSTLGTNPLCQTSASNIIITLGVGATISVGDTLDFIQNIIIGSLTTSACTSAYTQLISQPLTLPLVPVTQLAPSITFNNLDGVSSCQSQTIEFLQQYYDGMRQFKILSVTQVLPINDNNPQLANFLTQINSSPTINTPIQIPPYTLSHRTSYEFNFAISNFINQQNNQQLKFTTGSTEIVSLVFLTKDVVFYRYLQNQISAQITYQNCSLDSNQQTTLKVQWTLNNTLFQSNQLTGLDQGFSQIVLLTIPPFSLSFGQCTLGVTVTLDSVLLSKTFTFNVVRSALILSITGSNQQYGISQQINLSSNIINHDFQQGDPVQNYNYQWNCIDIQLQSDCLDMQSNIVPMGTSDQQIIAAKSLTPYRGYLINLTISYENKVQSISGSLAITELDLPVLLFNTSNVVNLYDESLITLIYPNTNADALSYSAAIVYNLDVQNTFSFFYLLLRYKQWDYFSNVTTSLSGNVTLRAAVYDPRYYMPSIAQIRYIFNVPPQNCEISFSDDFAIEFETLLTIKVENCYSINSPLLYRFSIYINQETYTSDIVSSQDLNRVLLADFSNSSSLQTFLYFNQTDTKQNENQIIMVTIQDQLNGITNLTKIITVKINPNLNEQIFDNLIQSKIELVDKIQAYQLVGSRLMSFTGNISYKSQIYNAVLEYLPASMTSSLLSVVEQVAAQLSQLNNIQVSNTTSDIDSNTQLNDQLTLINQTSTKLVYLSNLFNTGGLTSQLFQLYYQKYQQLNYLIQILSSQINFYSSFNISTTSLTIYLDNSIQLLQNLSLPNQPPNLVQSKYLNMLSAVQSEKIINQQTGNLLQPETVLGSNRLLQITDQVQIYKYSNRVYGLNPYQTDDSFPQNSTNYSCVEPSIINAQTLVPQPILQNATIKFNQKSKPNSTLQCISKISGAWQGDICSTKKSNDTVSCSCQQLSPVSLMNALDLLESTVGKSFTSDAINALDTFAFWETIIFYVYILFTLAYIVTIYKGYQMDKSMKETPQSDKAIEKGDLNDMLKSKEYKVIKLPKITLENEHQVHKIYPILEDLRGIIIEHNIKDHDMGSHGNIVSQQAMPITARTDIQPHISRARAYIIFIQQFHIVLNIIYKYDKNLSRPVRCSILYISTLGMLATIFMFGKQNNISLNIVIALILAPLTKVFSLIFEKLLSSQKRILKYIGVVLIFSVSGLWSYILLSQIALLGSVSQVNQLTINFLITWSFDNLIYAQIQLFVQFTVQTYIIMVPLLKRLLDKLLDEQSANFIEHLRQQL